MYLPFLARRIAIQGSTVLLDDGVENVVKTLSDEVLVERFGVFDGEHPGHVVCVEGLEFIDSVLPNASELGGWVEFFIDEGGPEVAVFVHGDVDAFSLEVKFKVLSELPDDFLVDVLPLRELDVEVFEERDSRLDLLRWGTGVKEDLLFEDHELLVC